MFLSQPKKYGNICDINNFVSIFQCYFNKIFIKVNFFTLPISCLTQKRSQSILKKEMNLMFIEIKIWLELQNIPKSGSYYIFSNLR